MKRQKNKIGIFFLGLALSLSLSSCTSFSPISSKPEKKGRWGQWESFEQLREKNKKSDYRITIKKKKNSPLVMGIHGGMIERGTSELALEIQKNWPVSLYLFEGLKAPDYDPLIGQSGHLHLTSHKFNDPNLISLAKKSPFCLSLHGFHRKSPHICLGGGASLKVKRELLKELEKGFPKMSFCVDCCPPYLGKNSQNPVNLCEKKGIQLEINPEARFKILGNPIFKEKLGRLLGGFLRKRFSKGEK